MLSDIYADQIANLLNERNQLTLVYDRHRVLDHAHEYLYRVGESGDVVACVQLKRVQWYQAEVLHLTVAASAEGKGHAKFLLGEVVRSAEDTNVRLLQCTIREGNEASRSLFEKIGFKYSCSFHNTSSGNNIMVLQRIIVSAA